MYIRKNKGNKIVVVVVVIVRPLPKGVFTRYINLYWQTGREAQACMVSRVKSCAREKTVKTWLNLLHASVVGKICTV